MSETPAPYGTETIHARLGRLTAELSAATSEAATIDHYLAMQRHDERCNRNRSLVAAANPEAALGEMTELLNQLHAALTEQIQATARVRAAKLHLEEARSLVYLCGQIDGKNETQRAAQLTLALRDDPAYQAARQDEDDAATALDVADARVEGLRRRLDASKARTRITAATIEALTL